MDDPPLSVETPPGVVGVVGGLGLAVPAFPMVPAPGLLGLLGLPLTAVGWPPLPLKVPPSVVVVLCWLVSEEDEDVDDCPLFLEKVPDW